MVFQQSRFHGAVTRGVGLAALCFAIAAGSPAARAADDVIRIGVMNDQSGVFSMGNGPGSVVAARMAVEDFGGKAAGKPVEIVVADHQNKPDVGSAIARQWFDEGGVDAIADLGNSAVALAVAEIAKQKDKVALISSGGATVLTGKQCSPNTVHWTYDTHSQAAPLAVALAEKGRDKWFFLTADYTFGYSLETEAEKSLNAVGGEVVGKVRHPLNTMDFSSFLLQAMGTDANVLALANGGDDTVRSIKQANEYRLTDKMVLVGLSALIIDIHSIGLETTQGLLLSLPFYWDMNEGTRAFAKRWSEQNQGRMPTMMQAGVYGAVLHYLKAVDALGSAKDGKAVVDEMKKLPTDDPLFGKGYVREDGRTIHDVYVFEVKKPSESKGPWDVFKLYATVPGEKAFLSMEEGGCPLVAKKG